MGDLSRDIRLALSQDLIRPNWELPEPAKTSVQAVCSTRQGGVSLAPFDCLNLALHVGDCPGTVQKNRQILQQKAKIPSPVCWLEQQHTTKVVYWQKPPEPNAVPPIADASWTDQPGVVLAVMTADCLPILLTNHAGTLVAAVHAGWKGCLKGVIEETIAQLPETPENLMAWIGPCIRQSNFEVGAWIQQAFIDKDAEAASCFTPVQAGKTFADLAGLGILALQKAGILFENIYDSGFDSFKQSELFYSYRRDGQTGRMASLIWL